MVVKEELLKMPGVYKIVNNVNGKFYIGSSVNVRSRKATHLSDLKNNKHHSVYLQRAFNKYGENSFEFLVVEYIDDKNEILNREQYYLDSLTPYDSSVGYNLSHNARNCTGVKHTQETREKLSKAHKGRISTNKGKIMSQEVRDKVSKGNKGKKRSDESKMRYSKSKLGRNNPNYQKTPSDEIRKNLMENHPFNKSIICIETGIRYYSISHASRELNIPTSNISAVCKGKRKRVHGLSFRYDDKQL